jgi:hypothetical protein
MLIDNNPTIDVKYTNTRAFDQIRFRTESGFLVRNKWFVNAHKRAFREFERRKFTGNQPRHSLNWKNEINGTNNN